MSLYDSYILGHRERELAELERARAALGLRSDQTPRPTALHPDERELAEFLAVAEGPVDYIDLVNDCFAGNAGRTSMAIHVLERAQLVIGPRSVYELTALGRALIGASPLVPA